MGATKRPDVSSAENGEPKSDEGIEQSLRERLHSLGLKAEELENQAAGVEASLGKLKANIGSRATPVEWLMGGGVTITALFGVIVLLCAFLRFDETLFRLAEAKPLLWEGFDRAITVKKGLITLARAEWPASSLAWAAGLGFVGLAVAISVVVVSASVALSRIRRE